jgi:hypothetical protein
MTQVYFRCSNPKEVLVDRCGAVVANGVTYWTIPTNGGMQGDPKEPLRQPRMRGRWVSGRLRRA